MASPSALPWRRGKNIAGFCSLLAIISLVWALRHRAEVNPYAIALASRPSSLIPRNIWQIWFPQEGASERYVHHPDLRETAGWIGMNPDHRYRLVGRAWGDAFVQQQQQQQRQRQRFARGAAATPPAGRDDLAATYAALRNHGLKSDLLRYLVLEAHGGVYTDIDTVALRPVDAWVPARYRGAARLVVGLEFDRRDGGMWSEIPHDLQFCQWTIAAAPGHPVFRAMADRALTSLHELAAFHNTTMAELKPSSFETMNSTGPAAWTDVVFEQIQLARPDITNLMNLSGIQEPQLYGDILVLNIDGFGMGQPHSGATNDGSIPEAALLKHLFRGSWRNS